MDEAAFALSFARGKQHLFAFNIIVPRRCHAYVTYSRHSSMEWVGYKCVLPSKRM